MKEITLPAEKAQHALNSSLFTTFNFQKNIFWQLINKIDMAPEMFVGISEQYHDLNRYDAILSSRIKIASPDLTDKFSEL